MIRAVLQVLANCGAILLAAAVVPGVHYQGGWLYLLLVGLVIGLINLLVKPLVSLLSLPLVILTLGLFYLVINGAMFALAAWLLSGLEVDGCLPAILGGLVIALANWLVRTLFSGEKE